MMNNGIDALKKCMLGNEYVCFATRSVYVSMFVNLLSHRNYQFRYFPRSQFSPTQSSTRVCPLATLLDSELLRVYYVQLYIPLGLIKKRCRLKTNKKTKLLQNDNNEVTRIAEENERASSTEHDSHALMQQVRYCVQCKY